MIIKEVIQGKIELLTLLEDNFTITIPESSNAILNLDELVNELLNNLENSKSINEIISEEKKEVLQKVKDFCIECKYDDVVLEIDNLIYKL